MAFTPNKGEPGVRNSEEILNVRLEADAINYSISEENMYFNS